MDRRRGIHRGDSPVLGQRLDDMVTEGLITEEKVKIILYEGNDKK